MFEAESTEGPNTNNTNVFVKVAEKIRCIPDSKVLEKGLQ